MSETPSRDNLRESARDSAMSVAAISSERIESDENAWTRRLVFFLRIMAVLSVAKGLYHWAQVTGFIGGEEEAFENQPMAWQTATVYFAVIELVAAVGLWLATPWGAVVWLTTVVSMAVIELMFPAIYGGSLAVVVAEAVMLTAYLALAWMAARERPPYTLKIAVTIWSPCTPRPHLLRRSFEFEPTCSRLRQAAATKREQRERTVNERLRKVLLPWA